MSVYPTAIDTEHEIPIAIDNEVIVTAEVFNSVRNAILAIETELGTNPHFTSDDFTTLMNNVLEFVNGPHAPLDAISLTAFLLHKENRDAHHNKTHALNSIDHIGTLDGKFITDETVTTSLFISGEWGQQSVFNTELLSQKPPDRYSRKEHTHVEYIDRLTLKAEGILDFTTIAAPFSAIPNSLICPNLNAHKLNNVPYTDFLLTTAPNIVEIVNSPFTINNLNTDYSSLIILENNEPVLEIKKDAIVVNKEATITQTITLKDTPNKFTKDSSTITNLHASLLDGFESASYEYIVSSLPVNRANKLVATDPVTGLLPLEILPGLNIGSLDKVDNFDAVAANSPIESKRNVLVATGVDNQLPRDIIPIEGINADTVTGIYSVPITGLQAYLPQALYLYPLNEHAKFNVQVMPVNIDAVSIDGKVTNELSVVKHSHSSFYPKKDEEILFDFHQGLTINQLRNKMPFFVQNVRVYFSNANTVYFAVDTDSPFFAKHTLHSSYREALEAVNSTNMVYGRDANLLFTPDGSVQHIVITYGNTYGGRYPEFGMIITLTKNALVADKTDYPNIKGYFLLRDQIVYNDILNKNLSIRGTTSFDINTVFCTFFENVNTFLNVNNKLKLLSNSSWIGDNTIQHDISVNSINAFQHHSFQYVTAQSTHAPDRCFLIKQENNNFIGCFQKKEVFGTYQSICSVEFIEYDGTKEINNNYNRITTDVFDIGTFNLDIISDETNSALLSSIEFSESSGDDTYGIHSVYWKKDLFNSSDSIFDNKIIINQFYLNSNTTLSELDSLYYSKPKIIPTSTSFVYKIISWETTRPNNTLHSYQFKTYRITYDEGNSLLSKTLETNWNKQVFGWHKLATPTFNYCANSDDQLLIACADTGYAEHLTEEPSIAFIKLFWEQEIEELIIDTINEPVRRITIRSDKFKNIYVGVMTPTRILFYKLIYNNQAPYSEFSKDYYTINKHEIFFQNYFNKYDEPRIVFVNQNPGLLINTSVTNRTSVLVLIDSNLIEFKLNSPSQHHIGIYDPDFRVIGGARIFAPLSYEENVFERFTMKSFNRGKIWDKRVSTNGGSKLFSLSDVSYAHIPTDVLKNNDKNILMRKSCDHLYEPILTYEYAAFNSENIAFGTTPLIYNKNILTDTDFNRLHELNVTRVNGYQKNKLLVTNDFGKIKHKVLNPNLFSNCKSFFITLDNNGNTGFLPDNVTVSKIIFQSYVDIKIVFPSSYKEKYVFFISSPHIDFPDFDTHFIDNINSVYSPDDYVIDYDSDKLYAGGLEIYTPSGICRNNIIDLSSWPVNGDKIIYIRSHGNSMSRSAQIINGADAGQTYTYTEWLNKDIHIIRIYEYDESVTFNSIS